jgi:hypothetical protein
VSEGAPSRPTDAAGFYSALAVLADASPLERYRPREQNADRAHVTLTCSDGESRRVEDGRGGLAIHCADGAVPVGAYDLAGAVADRDPHADAVCRARRYLVARMDVYARRSWARSIEPCRDEATGAEGRD